MLRRLILASASPRRRELLALLGLPYEVVPSRYDEPPAPNHPVDLADLVTALAVAKASEVAGRVSSAFVIGADTLVTLDAQPHGIPMGKPVDAVDACRMLTALSARPHYVYTGVAIVEVNADGSFSEPVKTAVRTQVTFRALSAEMIADYVATGEPLDKAGAYGAQGYAAPFIASFDGDFYNVVGLPICTVGALLERLGMEWWRHRKHMPPIVG